MVLMILRPLECRLQSTICVVPVEAWPWVPLPMSC